MSKDTFYFSHDCNARTDEKILALRLRHGWEGYGLFWALIEKLRESSDYTSVRDYNIIAYDLRTDANKIKSLVEDFGLFTFTEDGKRFYSESLNKRMNIKADLSQKRAEAGRKGMEKRWNKLPENEEVNNNVITNHNNKNKINKSKINVLLEKEPKLMGDDDFFSKTKKEDFELLDLNQKTNGRQESECDTQSAGIGEEKIDFKKLLIAINKITGKNFKVINDNTKRKYNARIKEGYTKQDILNAINNAVKDSFHIESGFKWLTPEYFSRSATIDKFKEVLSVENPKKEPQIVNMAVLKRF